jgi:hypothetical protein
MLTYCCRQRKQTETKDIHVVEGKKQDGRPFYQGRGVCVECGAEKTWFLSKDNYEKLAK